MCGEAMCDSRKKVLFLLTLVQVAVLLPAGSVAVGEVTELL
jgi:hypothetical protein